MSDVLRVEVPDGVRGGRGLSPGARTVALSLAVALGAVEQEEEALVGVGQVDHVVEHGLEELVDVAAVDELLAEGEELADAGQLGRDAGGLAARRARALVVPPRAWLFSPRADLWAFLAPAVVAAW